ncbi:MAG: DUF4142 domain-containing protein [Shinella sp.]|nr:DUF4142 domain-containing protein [Shinella sp.]
MRRWIITLVSLPLGAFSAAAQIGNPGFMGADTRFSEPGVPAPHQTNNSDRLFARLIAAGGMAEVDFGRLAADRAEAGAAKDFARLMVEDHTAANDKLKSLAEAAKIPLPDKLDPDHVRMRENLEPLNGRTFDIAYIEGQIVDHIKTVQLLEWEINSGEDAELQRFAAETLPSVLHHLELARNVHAELTGSTVRTALSR